MRWNIIVEGVGEEGKRSTITLGTIERVAGSTTAENLGVNLQESKQIANRFQDTVVKQQLHELSSKAAARRARASLEIITGRIEADAEQSKVFAVVRDQDGRAKQHVQAITRQRE